MLALRSRPASPYVVLDEVPEPGQLPHEALVAVRASSVNRGEAIDLAGLARGSPAGWDVAGVVERAAADGTGPAAGQRVVARVRAGAWAQRVAVPATALAAVPSGVTDAVAATLPTAGTTALRALEVAGLLLERRVLVTGATGGVGRFAVQLACLSGARVTALVRDMKATPTLRGADRVVETIDGEYDLVVDAVGGATLARAIEHLRPRGVVVNLATGSADETVTFTLSRFDRAQGASIHTLNLGGDDGRRGSDDLARLCALAAAGRLDPLIGLTVSWRDAAGAIDRFLRRRVAGKVVLRVD